MTNVRAQPGATRILSSQSLSFGSTAGASSAPFGVSTTLVRAMSNTPATIIIGDFAERELRNHRKFWLPDPRVAARIFYGNSRAKAGRCCTHYLDRDAGSQ